MKAKELRILSEKELDDKYLDLKKELIKINAQIATGTTPKSPGQVKTIKKTLAKIQTIKHQKNMEKSNQ